MHPVLFRLGPLTIHTYGMLVALAFLAGITLSAREGRRRGLSPDRIFDLGFYLLVSAIVGSRLLQVAVEHAYYLEHPIEIFQVWKGGLVFYGGFIAALLTGVWYVRKNAMPLWTVTDSFAAFVPLGQAIGRLGCFMAGCCYGAPVCAPWAVTFTDPGSLAALGVPLHPSQLYESAADLGLFVFLFSFRKKTAFDGQLFWLYVMLYSALRFTLEFWRGDVERGFMHVASFDLSTSQAIAVAAFLTSLVALTRLKGLSRKKG